MKARKKMSAKTEITWSAINNFVGALASEFKNDKPTQLYHRLLSKTTLVHKNAVNKHIETFATFCNKWADPIKANKVLPTTAIIEYTDKINIPVGKFMRFLLTHKRKDDYNSIRNHLITIISVLSPEDEEVLEQVEKIDRKLENLGIDTSTNEGQFIGGFMNKLKDTVGDTPGDNPMAAIAGLMGNGGLQELFGGLSAGIASGQLDMKKLAKTMKGPLATLLENLDDIDDEPKIVEIEDDAKVEEVVGRESILRFPGVEDITALVYLPLKKIKGRLYQSIVSERYNLDNFPEINDSSIAIRMTCYDYNVLLSGDSTLPQWREN